MKLYSILSTLVLVGMSTHKVNAFEQGLRRANVCPFEDESIARDNGEFVGCVKTDGRKCGEDLRFLPEGDKCDTNEQTIVWNQEGPPGVVKVTKVVSAKQTCNLGSGRDSCDISVFCPSGTVAISGGFQRTSGTDELALRISDALVPKGSVNPNGWRIAGEENKGRGGLEIQAIVLCTNVNE